MFRHSGWLVLLVAILGCGSGQQLETPTHKATAEEKPVGVGLEGGKLEPSLAELLRASRKELAVLCDETLETIRARRDAHDETDTTTGPLGAMRPALAVPIFRVASFSSAVELSLPPYLPAGKHDSAIAMHLARHGDTEAARKLVDPADRDALAQIEKVSQDVNVSLEWTRLVALRQHAAVLRLALNDSKGATDLVTLHRQVREALGPKALGGPLGAALLGGGKRAVQVAGTAWRERKRTELADQVDRVLQNWGETPFPEPSVAAGRRWAEALRALQAKENGRVARADVLRGLDLLALPLPESGATAVLAFRDGDRLGEVLVLYQTVGRKGYRDPGHLAFGLEDIVAGVADDAKATGMMRRRFALGPTVCEVGLTPRTGLVSGFVRVDAGKALAVPPLPRDFGSVHLDRPFEQNRVQIAPAQKGDVVHTGQRDVLDRVENPLKPAGVSKLVLRREPGHTATEALTLFYAPADTTPPLAELALPAWSAWGAGRFEAGSDEEGGYLGLTWGDARTRIVLRAPYTQTEAVALVIQDIRPTTVRDPGSAAFDQEERKARLAAGKPLVRLPRNVEPIGVQLGESHEQATQALPSGRDVYTREVPQGLMTTLTGELSRGSVIVPRQVFVRFDPNGKVGEVRVRFEDLAVGSQKRGSRELLDGLIRQAGAGVEGKAPWAAVWADRSTTQRTWRDDLTVMTFQSDAAGAEVSVRACPVDQPDGVVLPPLEYLPRGPEACALGATRDGLGKWNVKEPVTTADGALVLHPAKGSPYDVLLVYFTADKVDRVLARHAQSKPLSLQPRELAAAVTDAWGRDLRSIGWPRRQDLGVAGLVQALSFHDERTLVKVFWQDDSKGKPSVFTEWRNVPH